MNDLIEALQIFLKYANFEFPTSCCHDELSIVGIDPLDVSKEDIDKLEHLGFFISEDDDCFKSYRFGSA